METKFQVGQVWRNRNGDLRKITNIDIEGGYPIATFEAGEPPMTYGENGKYYGNDGHDSEYDLVEFVTNADGTPAIHGEPLAASIVNMQPIEGATFDTTRTEFIDKLTHDVFLKYVGDGFAGDAARAADYVRAAVNVRDELVHGDAE